MKLSVDELLRLACVFAEMDREEYLRCVANGGPDSPEYVETAEFLKQLRAYRMRRWGKTHVEKAVESGVSVPVNKVADAVKALGGTIHTYNEPEQPDAGSDRQGVGDA
jgi:hypothetical protein